MPRDGRVFLDDIAAACRKIGRYTSSLGFEQFREDEKTVDAVLRNLEVIGEAAKKLPPPMRQEIKEIDWSRIAGLRDVLIHELRFLAALGGTRTNALFFTGDLGQRIFQQPFSWKEIGVDVRGGRHG